MAETEIMFSYLIFVGFITVMFTLTGQTVFGTNFPENPFTDLDLTYASGCDIEQIDFYICEAGYTLGKGLAMISIPFIYLGYLFAMFIFFMTSPLWWLGLIVFVPAGIVFILILHPIIVKIAELILRLLHAITEAIPF